MDLTRREIYHSLGLVFITCTKMKFFFQNLILFLIILNLLSFHDQLCIIIYEELKYKDLGYHNYDGFQPLRRFISS
jgi:hypothetical protein